ncbi:ATP-binding cassette domain-containing protein [Sphaerisporangium rubeum]|uniref:ATPase subunit of ABC transporter with duplicated ATPase domains n=1 Tax=Sphaerisporangium rubeum TaxID=321317 RepID=A0A7X0IAR6_9ACTN|nr:ATP-binding cassette domain-containing protein [Sphaerisporangium rubeum]MBB6471024.1 ATPase subunit of ABC transporter with duplicated ATPase domains [Sphaerisporangium rubeum]
MPDGRPLLAGVSFHVGEGLTAGLVGPDGAGKTTLLRLIAGDLRPASGRIGVHGGIGFMRRSTGAAGGHRTVRDMLFSIAPPKVRATAATLAAAEASLVTRDDERTRTRHARALTDHYDSGGYELEAIWDVCARNVLGLPFEQVADHALTTLSCGDRKRLALETLLHGTEQLLLLDEPDDGFDVRGKELLEDQLRVSPKTILLVSRDRQLLANAANRIISVENGGVRVHVGGYATFAGSRGVTRRHGLPGTRPSSPARHGERTLACRRLALTGLTEPFELVAHPGERIAVVGPNDTAKSLFLRLITESAGPREPTIPFTGVVDLSPGVWPGHFTPGGVRPDLDGRSVGDIVAGDYRLGRDEAMAALDRYAMANAWRQTFDTLTVGQRTRLQILLLELAHADLLLLDEPTRDLDTVSADALQRALRDFPGPIVAITSDRWFTADFTRYLHFAADGRVREVGAPVWEPVGDGGRARGQDADC